MMLVSVEVAKVRLKYDEIDEEDDLELAIQGASEAVASYLALVVDSDGTVYDGEDSSGIIEGVPAVVVNAVIALVGYWKRDPTGVDMRVLEANSLPRHVVSILAGLRDPTVS